MSAALDTTELRWFGEGAPPAVVTAWFSRPGAATEVRCDRYLLGQPVDVGLKVRGGRTLELKLRGGAGAWLDLGGGLRGRPEAWRKWSPADGVVEVPGHARWISVRKAVVKRRFSLSGSEVAVTGGSPGSGCDVEVAQLAVGPLQAWTFAFAATGPRWTRDACLQASWRALAAGDPVPRALVRDSMWSMGYPQWLARMLAADSAAVAAVDGFGEPARAQNWPHLFPGRVG